MESIWGPLGCTPPNSLLLEGRGDAARLCGGLGQQPSRGLRGLAKERLTQTASAALGPKPALAPESWAGFLGGGGLGASCQAPEGGR